ncbi:hypothetical protein POJ06DRAFT_248482 [Lipomyces tetrasporus]|uniref:Uncharacterized protein n=1 Tax=Lipomyces tetrasporus TaxID=54092 RepID=A0AAD7QV02_9ASCO|nr:uncharacterized protein POJ06DRAFT_248482 [Lipomyces tetrasporus]KAJ8102004.1 hypothetical protein POJ06DRAFT_248482 [Lipomyces tetrasporus]
MSFLPYCTVCDKQLTVPNNNILYCSEKCRRKDARAARKVSPAALGTPPSWSSTSLASTGSYPSGPGFQLSPSASQYSDELSQATHSRSIAALSSTPPLRNNGSNVDLPGSYTSASAMLIAKGSRQRHPNSVYSSSPRSIDLVSPFVRSPPASDPGSTSQYSTGKPPPSSFAEPSYDMPLVVEKKTELHAGPAAQPKEGSLKKLFYFNEIQKP